MSVCPVTPRGDERHGSTAVTKLRIGLVGFGTGREKVPLERGTNPKRSRRTCSPRHGLQSWGGKSTGRETAISHPKSPIRNFFLGRGWRAVGELLGPSCHAASPVPIAQTTGVSCCRLRTRPRDERTLGCDEACGTTLRSQHPSLRTSTLPRMQPSRAVSHPADARHIGPLGGAAQNTAWCPPFSAIQHFRDGGATPLCSPTQVTTCP